MSSRKLNHFRDPWRRPVILSLMLCQVLTGTLTAPAQNVPSSEADQIREELRQLKQDYEQRIQKLEERLRRIETPAVSTNMGTPAPSVQAPSPASQLSSVTSTNAVAEAKRFAEEQFRQDTESRERALLAEPQPFRERIEQVLQEFLEFHGYFRAGYGRDDQGGPQVGFQAPGAFAKYRLGNEAENYGELTLGKNFYVPNLFKLDARERPDGSPAGPIARVQTTISIYDPYQDLLTSSSTTFGLPEAFASIGNVVAAQPSMKFWAGNRFYRRHDIHVSDFFFLNMSGSGGGVEDVQLPFGKAALAWIGAGVSSGFSDLPQPEANNEAGFSKANWDLRLYDVPLPLGKGEFGLVYARADSGRNALGQSQPGSDGVAVTALHTRDHFISGDGVNKFSLQFGTGAASTFTSGFETFANSNGVFILSNPVDSWRFRLTEHFTANVSDHFAIGPAVVYQFTDNRDGGGNTQWLSGGVRPIIVFNKYFNVAFETGVDWVKDTEAGTSSYLGKFTLAPEVSLGNRFMSRPVIRAFITYAHWGEPFRGQIGGNDYADSIEGLTYGIQMEAWW
jgi:maltoporin